MTIAWGQCGDIYPTGALQRAVTPLEAAAMFATAQKITRKMTRSGGAFAAARG
jgi:hypothetical protein